MEQKKHITIPEDVVNPIEYRKMLALERHPVIRNTTYISSEGDEINIAMLPHRLKKYIEHLSPKEQEDILELKRKYNQMRAKISTAKSLAYGRAGRYGGKSKEQLDVYKLSPFEEDIIELLGRMFTVAEVVKIMGEDNGVIVSEEDVKGILKKHIVEIERKREEFRNRVADVRLYNKRPRLEELAWMYSKMKARYVALNGVDAYNSMLRTLEQIRKEAEGDVLNINGVVDVNIEVTIQNHIQKEILRAINLKEIILGRVAARMNYDPKKLIAGLHNSYYAKFVDISGDFDENAEMSYPSNSAYDFGMIERTAGREVMDVKAEDVTEAEHSSATNVKDLFLSKIRKQKQDMEARAAGWDAEAERKRPVAEDEDPIERNTPGRAKDKIPPSKTKAGQYKNKGKDYFTGDKKKK
jgi:hypothetical protein